MPLHLLIITAEPWPTHRADVAALFGHYLPRLGITSDLVTLVGAGEESPWGGGRAFLGVDRGGVAGRYLLKFMHSVRGLSKARSGIYDAVQVRDLPLIAAFGLMVSRWRALPFFYWMSYPMPEGHLALARERGLRAGVLRYLFPWFRGHFCNWLLYRIVLPRADHVFVQSDRMLEDLAARGIDPQRMTPVPMGVDLAAVSAVSLEPLEDQRLAGRRVLVYLGTLDRPRRLERLFEMLALVRHEFPAAVLVLVGDCSDADQRLNLKQAAVAAGVEEHVIWVGWLPTASGWRYVRAAEVGLSPIPRSELLDCASPTKACEYLALGIPVVGNDNPDQAMLLDASRGGLCVEFTPGSFAAAVVQLLRLEPIERAAMAARGAAWVAQERAYSVIADELALRYEAIFLRSSATQS